MLSCFILYFNFGIRSGGGIGDIIGKVSFSNKYLYLLRFITDLIFYISVILLVMNMINGIIISTFSFIREDSENKTKDLEGKCFICSIEKNEFEKKKVSYRDHCKTLHNISTYLYYLMMIKTKNLTELDYDQTYIRMRMNNNDIGFFPINQTLALE